LSFERAALQIPGNISRAASRFYHPQTPGQPNSLPALSWIQTVPRWAALVSRGSMPGKQVSLFHVARTWRRCEHAKEHKGHKKVERDPLDIVIWPGSNRAVLG
jgi:hypothetical protein